MQNQTGAGRAPNDEEPRSRGGESLDAKAEQTKAKARRKAKAARQELDQKAAEVQRAARDKAEDVEEKAREMAEQAKAQAASWVDSQREVLAGEIEAYARALDVAADTLEEEDHLTSARYTREAARQIERFANHAEGRSFDQLMNDAERMSREQPGLFVGGAMVMGFFASRFFKSSAERGTDEPETTEFDSELSPGLEPDPRLATRRARRPYPTPRTKGGDHVTPSL